MENEPSASCDLTHILEVGDVVEEKSEHLSFVETALVSDGAEVGGPVRMEVRPCALPDELARLTIHVVMGERVWNTEAK